jgi:hypothetical protein
MVVELIAADVLVHHTMGKVPHPVADLNVVKDAVDDARFNLVGRQGPTVVEFVVEVALPPARPRGVVVREVRAA